MKLGPPIIVPASVAALLNAGDVAADDPTTARTAASAAEAAPIIGTVNDEAPDGNRASLGTIPHAEGAFVIDGVLDDGIWQEALMVELGVETTPRENMPAAVRTYAYLAENGSHLLVAFDARDADPRSIRAYLRDRDSAYADDFVGIVLDTFGDRRRGFEFFANALGVQMDLINDGITRTEDDSWNAIWESYGAISGEGYVVEMAIPYNQLRFPRGAAEQAWGIDLVRFHPREDRVRLSITPLDRGRNCYLCQLPSVQGVAHTGAGRHLEVVPSAIVSRLDEREDPEVDPLLEGPWDTELGLNARWAVTPDVTANFALNPDFSQVEADVPQLDVNNQFALFFPESRPFFIEAADYFSTPVNAVFTRTVGDPDLGAKLTGRRGDHTFGLFAVDDEVTNFLLPGPLESDTETLEMANRAFVGRYSRGFGEASAIGLLLTARDGDGYDNRAGGIDGRYRITDEHNIRFQTLRSRTTYPDAIVGEFDQPAGEFSGSAEWLNYDFTARNWFTHVHHESFDPGFRADTGFLPRVDFEQQSIEGGRIWHGEDGHRWNRITLGGRWGRTHDQGGLLLARSIRSYFAIAGPRQSFVRITAVKRQQFWDGRLYDARNFVLFAEARPRSGLYLSMLSRTGDQVDFDNSRLGDQLRVEATMRWNMTRHLLLRFRHTSVTLDSKAGPAIFDAQLSDLRLTRQFSLRSFVRLTAQRQRVERNLALFVDEEADARSLSLGWQLLYSYKINPQTVFFVGYSDNHLEEDDVLGRIRTDRAFFMKASYAWAP